MASANPIPTGRAGRCSRAWVIFLLMTGVVLGADLGIKAWSFRVVTGQPVLLTRQSAQNPQAFWSQYPHQPWNLVPGLLSLQLTTNTGAVFGQGKGRQFLFILASLVAVIFLTRMFWVSNSEAWVTHLALALVLAGALGNLYDRVVYNQVRDMFKLFPDVHLPWGLSWPNGVTEVYPWIFNLADASLLIGVGLLIILIWRNPKPLPAPAGQTPRS